jgi:hypothetical protein
MVEKKVEVCSPRGFPYNSLMAAAIIVLLWISNATWSKIAITILAALLLLGPGSMCKSRK